MPTVASNVCEWCGLPFVRGRRPRRGCCPRCSAHLSGKAKALAFADRFNEKINKHGRGCWRWTGAKNPGGYGMVSRGGIRVVASRAAWELENGPIPDGLWVLHRCDRRICVRVSHLYLGTPSENATDCAERGPHNTAKLNPQLVREMRRRYAAGENTKTLASAFDVSYFTAYKVTRRLTWRRVC